MGPSAYRSLVRHLKLLASTNFTSSRPADCDREISRVHGFLWTISLEFECVKDDSN